MTYYAALDVSLRSSNICVINGPVCQRLMSAPGVGFITALTFKPGEKGH